MVYIHCTVFFNLLVSPAVHTLLPSVLQRLDSCCIVLSSHPDLWKRSLSAHDFIIGSISTSQQGENYTGTPGYFAPKMQKRALENKKEPLRNAIDCNVKACLNKSCIFSQWDVKSVAHENRNLSFGLLRRQVFFFQVGEQKVDGANSGEYGGWSTSWKPQSRTAPIATTDLSAGALSWWNRSPYVGFLGHSQNVLLFTVLKYLSSVGLSRWKQCT